MINLGVDKVWFPNTYFDVLGTQPFFYDNFLHTVLDERVIKMKKYIGLKYFKTQRTHQSNTGGQYFHGKQLIL